MEDKKRIFASLNPLHACRKYDVPAWQCPQFLFLIMGIVIAVAMIATYVMATMKIGDPFIVSLIVIAVTAVLMIISFIITNSFERIADASKLKTEFIAIISHQLRSPLTNLRFSLDFLTSKKLSQNEEDKQEYYSILKENTKRMGDLIDNLLTVSRIESGKFPLKKEVVSLETITSKLLLKFKPFIEASNVRVIFKEPGNLPNTIADSLWVEQIIENLLDNAVKYTKGGGLITITIKKKEKSLLFSIRDTGVGIPKNEQKYIFSRFFRSGNALKKQTKGAGLGLHIVKKVVERFGGKIWFKSKEGKGTIFYFSLPVKKYEKNIIH